MLDMSSLPAGFGVSFRLRSESGNVAFDNIEISSVSEPVDVFVLGDVNQDGRVDLGDIGPFTTILFSGGYSTEADVNEDGVVDLGDIRPFVDILFP